jgi:hypothetical protein
MSQLLFLKQHHSDKFKREFSNESWLAMLNLDSSSKKKGEFHQFDIIGPLFAFQLNS